MYCYKVPQKLKAFCNELNARRKALAPADIAAIYELSFWAHYELATIHPWADGNGRSILGHFQTKYSSKRKIRH